MEFFATTITGLEDVAAREVKELIGSDAESDVGKVIFKGDILDAALLNYASRSLNRVFITLVRSYVRSLEDIERCATDIDYAQFIEPHQSFAVRAERHGEHQFISPQIAAAVGRAVIRSYRDSRGVRLRVDLDDPDVELYALVRGEEFFLGINTSGKSLHHRFYRVWHHRAALPATIAYSLLRLNGWSSEKVLLDPFCGGATIPIEAGLVGRSIYPGLRRGDASMKRLKFFEQAGLERLAERLRDLERRDVMLRIIAADASPKCLKGAELNIESAGLVDAIRLVEGDARFVHRWLDTHPDCIVTNPPFGVRMGIRRPEVFYSEVFKSLTSAAPDARITILATKSGLVKRCLEALGWEITHRRTIVYGTLTTSIITAER